MKTLTSYLVTEFFVQARRLQFIADELTSFPALAANAIRGALGEGLPQSDGAPNHFRPSSARPSGFRQPPRPFVLRTHGLNGLSVEAGQAFSFDVHTFDCDDEVFESFLPVFRSWSTAGIGPKRSRVRLSHVNLIGGQRFTFDTSSCSSISRVILRFVTPTELKAAGDTIERPEFPALFSRLRERISLLATLYGGAHDLLTASAYLSALAAEVKLTECDLDWVSAKRRSSRTGQVHPLSGFTGTATYEGRLGPFMTWLEAAYWTGVGRQTVWGKGAVEVLSRHLD